MALTLDRRAAHWTALGTICQCQKHDLGEVAEAFFLIPFPNHVTLSPMCEAGVAAFQNYDALGSMRQWPPPTTLNDIRGILFRMHWCDQAWYHEFATTFLSTYSVPAAVWGFGNYALTSQRKIKISALTLYFFCVGKRRCMASNSACRIFDTSRQSIAYDIRSEKLHLGQVPTACHVYRMLCSMVEEGLYHLDYSRITACHDLLVAFLWTPLKGYLPSVDASINKAALVIVSTVLSTDVQLLGVQTALVYGAVLGHYHDVIREKSEKRNSKLRWLNIANSATATFLGAAGAVGGGAIGAAEMGPIIRDGSKEIGQILISAAKHKLSKKEAELRMWAQSVVNIFNNQVIRRARTPSVKTKIPGFKGEPTRKEARLFVYTAFKVLSMLFKRETILIEA